MQIEEDQVFDQIATQDTHEFLTQTLKQSPQTNFIDISDQ